MSETARPPALDSLTGLRFFAAFHVVLYHYGADVLPWEWARRFAHAGYSAVSLFYVLSGFVLTYNYGDVFLERRMTRRSFWLARAARVYPLYLLLVIAEVGLSLLVYHLPTRVVALAAVAHVALLQCWIPVYMLPGNRPGWSIGDEAFFYLLFPWIVVRFFRSQRRLELIGTILVTWGLGMAVAYGAARSHPSTMMQEVTLVCPLSRCFEFAVGIGTARLWMLDRREGRTNGAWVALPALVLIVLLTAQERFFPYIVFNNGGLALLYAAAIYGLAHGGGQRVLGSRPLVALGEASYALYLLQQPVFQVLGVAGFVLDGLAARSAYFAVLLLASFAAHWGVERPLQRWIRGEKWREKAERGDLRRDISWLALPLAIALALGLYAYASSAHAGVFGAEPVVGVKESGFYDQEWDGDVPFRWTNGEAVLRIPIQGERPRLLHIHLQSDNPHGATVDVRVNGKSRFSGPIPAVDWSPTFSLDGVRLDGVAKVEIRSSTFRPRDSFPDSIDARSLGVRVLLVSLE